MNICVKSLPTSLTASIAKHHGYNAADAVLYSKKSPLLNVIKVVGEAVQLIFKSLLAMPLDLLYIPIAFTAKKIWDRKHAEEQSKNFFHIDTVQHWSGRKGETEVSAEDSLALMTNPKKFGLKTVKLPVARCEHLQMTEEDLPEFLDLVNQYTLNVPYLKNNITSRYFGSLFEDTYIHRPNHNGTHSTRQLRLVEVLCDWVEKEGAPETQAIAESMTTEEKLNLKLAAYFMRAGRVDESGWQDRSPDRIYKVRSANVYEAYARQLYANQLSDPDQKKHAEEMIAWTCQTIINASTFDEKMFSSTDKKDLFCRDLLHLSHNIDLIRCKGEKGYTENIILGKLIAPLFGTSEQEAIEEYWPPLLELGKKLCDATGSARMFDKVPFNKDLFRQCSQSGRLCLEKVRDVGLPS